MRKKLLCIIINCLLVCAFINMTILVSAAVIKSPTVFVGGSGSLTLTWNSGKTQRCNSDTYVNLAGLDAVGIFPAHGWHIGAVLIDNNVLSILDEDGFSLSDVHAKNTISVTFLENSGVDDVGTGSNVEAYPNPYVGLVFTNVSGQGWVYANATLQQPSDAKGGFWDVRTTATFVGDVTIILVLKFADLPYALDPYSLRLLRTENELIRADVNMDGVIEGTDVSIVANSNPSRLGDPKYDARLDMNNDFLIDDLDVNIVNDHIGEFVWTDITLQVTVANGLVYVYGSTNHFSIFGVH